MTTTKKTALVFATLIIVGYFAIIFVNALPTGASLTNISTLGAPVRTAGNRTDTRGTITTILFDVIQQDQYWKAYVGNISGRLTLDNPSGFTIYEWALAGVNKSGEVYVSRASNIDFEAIFCANDLNVSSEHLFYNMTFSQADNINKTFNYTSHSEFYTGNTHFIVNDCRSTATYVSDAAQVMNGNQQFQEILLMDGANNLVYTTIIGTSIGYDGNNYDFQILVPDSGIRVTPTTYYFYTELG